MNETEFVKTQGEYFYLRTIKYVNLYTSEDELQTIRENNHVLSLTFEQGRLTIRWNDLVEKAEIDLQNFKKNNPEIEYED